MAAKLTMTASQQKMAAALVKALTPTLGFNGACGAVGNMMAESRLNPSVSAMDTNKKMSGGLCQWNGPRFAALKAMASQQGKSWTNAGVQIAFLEKELSTGYKSTLSACRNASSAEAASVAWGQGFEKFAGYKDKGGAEHVKRQQYSKMIYNGIKGGTWNDDGLALAETEGSDGTIGEEGAGTEDTTVEPLQPDIDPSVYVAQGGELKYSQGSNRPSPNTDTFTNITGYGIDWENDDSLIVFEEDADYTEADTDAQGGNATQLKAAEKGKLPPTLSKKLESTIAIAEHSVFGTEKDLSEKFSAQEETEARANSSAFFGGETFDESNGYAV